MDLMFAIDHANRICDWQENLTEDEMPPSWMWAFDEELATWFEAVHEARSSGEQASGSGSGYADTTVPMMSNEMAEGRGR